MILSILSIALLISDSHYQAAHHIRQSLLTLSSPMQWLVDTPIELTHYLTQRTQSHLALTQENQTLKKNLFELQTQLQTLESLKEENNRLRALLGSSNVINKKTSIGKLMNIDLNPLNHKVVLNRGTKHGISVGHPVLDANGVMGQVTEVTPFTSTALLVTDASHAIPALINRTGGRVIVQGSGIAEQMVIKHLAKTADIKLGDLLTTSGLGERFPPGYPVGTITSIEAVEGEAFLKVIVTPAANVHQSNYVLFTWPDKNES